MKSSLTANDTPLSRYNHKYKRVLADYVGKNIVCQDYPSVLDVGCRKGVDLAKILGLRKNIRGLGVDLSFESLVTAAEHLKEHKAFCVSQAMAEQLPFKNQVFDVVVSSEVLEHLSEPDQLICEARRVLRDDGVLIMTTPSKYNYTRMLGRIFPPALRNYLRRFIYHYPQGNEGEGDPHFKEYSVKEVRAMCVDNGFAVEDVVGGVLRVPIWPLFEKVSFLVTIWSGLDGLLNKFAWGINLKLNFVIVCRKKAKEA